jgi:hypothetical protein
MLGVLIVSQSALGETLTADQLSALVSATHAQYRTVDMEYEVQRFRIINGKRSETPEGQAKRQLRKTPTRSLSVADKTELDAKSGKPYTTTVKHAFTETWSKRLISEQNFSRGVIQRDGMKEELDIDPCDAMWTYGDVWKRMNNANTQVKFDPSTEQYTVIGQIFGDGSSFSGTIDVKMGYLPTRVELRDKAGKPIMWTECKDFRKVDETLWLPFSITSILALQFEVHYSVSKAVANIEIPEQSLDFAFPKNTLVRDNIAGLHYRVDEVREHQENINNIGRDDGIVSRSDTLATRPVSDATLAAFGDDVKSIRDAESQHPQRFWIFVGVAALAVVLCYSGWRLVSRRLTNRKTISPAK